MAGALSAIKSAVSELIEDTKAIDKKYEGFVTGEYKETIKEVKGRLKKVESAVKALQSKVRELEAYQENELTAMEDEAASILKMIKERKAK
jgi:hypothetical protein